KNAGAILGSLIRQLLVLTDTSAPRAGLCENAGERSIFYCGGRSDGYQQSKSSRRDIFIRAPPTCTFKEAQGVCFCAVIWAHKSVLCRPDADPRQGLESAARTKRLESAGRTKWATPTLCAGERKSRGHRVLYANEGKFPGPYNRADVTFGPGIGVV